MRAHLIFSRAALAVACSLALVQGVHAQAPAEAADPAAPVAGNSPMDGEMFLQLLESEMNIRRGDKVRAWQLMIDAARRTKDEGLFRRGLQMAYALEDGPAAVAAVQAWRLAVPGSVQAAREEVEVLLQVGRYAEAAVAAKAMLDLTAPSELTATFVWLPRQFSRNKNSKQTLGLLEPVLKPWMDKPATRVAATTALARLAGAAGDYGRAAALAARAHAFEPAAEMPAQVALALMKNSDQAEAIVVGHLQAKPDSTEVRSAYAGILSSMRRYADAATQFQALIKGNPQSAANRLALAALQVELKRPDEAIATLNTYLAGLRDGSIVQATPAAERTDDAEGDDGEGGDDAVAPLSAADQGTIQAYFLLARAAGQKRDYAGAERWLAKVNDPQRTLDVAARRAELLADQGKLKQAVDVVRKAPADTPAAERLKFVLEAQLYNDAKQWEASEKVFAAGVKRFPKDEELIYQQAMAAEKLNRVEAMEKLLRRVIEIRPDHFHAYNALGYSLAERNLRLPEARTLIVKALELSPGEPLITDSLGWVEYRLGNIPEAVRLLREAYRQRPEAEIGAHLGEVLWVSGERDEARRVLRAARDLDASNDTLKQTLARLKVDL